jgi:hypothetical protein
MEADVEYRNETKVAIADADAVSYSVLESEQFKTARDLAPFALLYTYCPCLLFLLKVISPFGPKSVRQV